jgi:iron complex outermembrane recepter protein
MSKYKNSVRAIFLIVAVTMTSGAALAQTAGVSANGSTNTEAPESKSGTLQTVTVTAEKKLESSLDVPMALTALTGDQLESSQSFRFEDYVGEVPGLTLIDTRGEFGSQLVIRGITSGQLAVNSSVATYIDETPYGVPGPFAASWAAAPNLDTFDMQRIEVLKGPQGTLYGSNAMAGLLKYVTNPPDPSDYAARIEAGVNSVYNGNQGFDYHAMINVPIADDLAIRLVGYDNNYPGFIDDPARAQEDINGVSFVGGRASLLYQPTANLSIRFNALYQQRSYDDFSSEDVNPGTLTPIYGPLNHETLINQPGQTTNELYNATIDWDAGFAKIVSATSYSALLLTGIADQTLTFGSLCTSLLHMPCGEATVDRRPADTWTQEIRLSTPGSGPLQWQVGGFFTNEHSIDWEAYFPVDIPADQIVYSNPIIVAPVPTTYQEYAGFANLDYSISPTFDLAVGGRYSHNDQTFHETTTGLIGGLDFGNTSSEGVFTYSVDARWHVQPRTMLYARIATGFVPGGPNVKTPTETILSSSYSSSTTLNYEAGIKSSLLDDRLTLEVSAFDIDWKRIQLVAIVGGFGSVVNGGEARSEGGEWNLVYAPIDGLKLSLNGAYTNAYLTESTPASLSVGGQVGDRLPSVPLWAGSASAEYERPLTSRYSGFAGLDWRFTGSRYAEFEPSSPRQQMPSYGILDVRAGLQTDRWVVSFFVKNVANKIAINYLWDETNAGGLGPQAASLYTPRTIGATVTANFK